MNGNARRAAAGGSRDGPRAAARGRGPRWVVSWRALIVVLAMMCAALGVLWVESSGVQIASAQLAKDDAGTVTVPPLGSAAPTPVDTALPDSGAAGTGLPDAGAGQLGQKVPASASAGGTLAAGVLVVHVAGAVKSPGVYLLAPHSRVFQALDAAGGTLPGAAVEALNLAAVVADGGKILVPTLEEAAAMAALPGPAHIPGPDQAANEPGVGGVTRTGPLNLNTATAAEFESLPGVGPVLAGRMVQWRTDHGPFSSVDGLNAVTGIGPKLLAALRELVTAP